MKSSKTTESIDHLHKIVLIGDKSVGKTTIIQSLQDNFKSKENVVGCAVKFFKVDETKRIQLVFWDSNSSSETLLRLYLRNVELIIFVVDVQKLNDSVEFINETKRCIHSFIVGQHIREEYQTAIFVNKLDLALSDINGQLDEKMREIMKQTGIKFWCFGSAINDNVQSLIEMSAKIIDQTIRTKVDAHYQWCWLQFVIRSNLDTQFFTNLRLSQDSNNFKFEHHIPIRMPQMENENETSPLWWEMEQVTKQTCFESIERNLGKRSNIVVTVNKIPRPSGVDQSRFTVLVSVWFDCSSNEIKPSKISHLDEISTIEQNDSNDLNIQQNCQIC